MTNIVSLDEYRSKKEDSTYRPQDEVESLELMKSIITILLKYKYNAYDVQTAENMILLSMLFQAHINHLNDIDDDLFEVFSLISERLTNNE
jgi:hypothetical protein